MFIQTTAQIVLALAAVVLLLFMYGQLQRQIARRKLLALQQRLLQEQIANTIAERERPAEHTAQAWNGWRKFRLDKVVTESDSVRSFYLLPHDGKSLATFKPGQHLTFRLKVPGQSKPVIRCYSLSDSGEQTDYYRVSIKKQIAPVDAGQAPDGLASCYFHDHLKAGHILDVKAPAGQFYLDTTEQSPVVLVAGGIGLTPSLAMLNTLQSLGSERDICLFYGVRHAGELVMTKHLQAMAARPNVKVHWVFSEPTESCAQAGVAFHHGWITVGLLQQCGALMDADFYICGPPMMMKSVVAGLDEAGVDQGRVHFESFGPAHVDRAAKTTTTAMADAEPVAVEFGLAGKSANWTPVCGTLLELAEANGIEIDNGCRAGSCGTCLTAVLAGEVDYVDEPGSAVEQGSCLPCIAVPKSDLKLNA